MAKARTTAPKQWNQIARKPGDITADGLRCMKFNDSSMTTKVNTYMREIKVQYESMPHFGLMMKGEFIVANSHCKATYRWCLIHCLQTGDHNTKLDFFHSNDINDCKKRLVGVFGLNDPSQAFFTQDTWTPVTAPADYCCKALDHLLSCRFDMSTGTLISQKYGDKANCILASRSLLAIFQMKNPKDMIEETIQPIRGELLRNGDQKLDDFTGENNGIGCENGWAFWNTLATKETSKGSYKLQQHRSGLLKKEALVFKRGEVGWSIHDKEYRIIFQKKSDQSWGSWGKYLFNTVAQPVQAFSKKWWKDIARTDNEEEIRRKFQSL